MCAVFESERIGAVRMFARAYFGAGKILKDRDRNPGVGRDAAQIGDDGAVFRMRSVREIQPRHVETRIHERA